ncbi:MAG: DUF2158 domain-containing protein [Proteobacteria bacterium]|nr:DUF2158 domain-containing protein [Pseudomonadota bacterium]
MASTNWKPGNLVELKAGGPLMVVDSVDHYGKVWCSWFAGKKHEKAGFAAETLQTPSEEKK